jgi:hydrogenase maturation protein HypF
MERRAIAIQGTVQGVGFRPFVFGLAHNLQLAGFVKNNTGGVRIEVEGDGDSLDEFLAQLVRKLPPLARIDEISWHRQPALGDRQFRIESSDQDSSGSITIAPDVATCDDCLAELFDPRDRRFRYPFLNCTNCGPRLTIVTGAPYDRERTTMAGFPLCLECRAEYEDPTNRRFHAQPTACPLCGPKLTVLDGGGRRIAAEDALKWFAAAIRDGNIGAMKGLGGYHLICNARSAKAVAELRRRKNRDEKPLAVMVPDLDSARALCEIEASEQALLTSPRRPIVLLRKREGNCLVDEVAPRNPRLGLMLPYSPLHHLLTHEVNGVSLVMTSGNRSDEPIAYTEADAVEVLRGICDLFLVHDRPINVRCDDSVTRMIGGIESPVRRSRGYAPQPIALPMACRSPILAVGGQVKDVYAFGSGRRAILSHHIGDLDHFKAYGAFEQDIALYEKLFGLTPAYIAHDMHPDYASTRYAQSRAIKRIPIQHHHAHMASCMAENGLNEPMIGVTFDGTGFGLDGAIWGGEFLVGGYRRFRRAAHLRYVAMPGGEKAVREPWRMAAAYLFDAEANCRQFESRIPPASLQIAQTMIRKNLNAPMTSSMGRLFDGVASLVGLQDNVSFEGQAAMRLEWLAESAADPGVYPFEISKPTPADAFIVDTRPIIFAIVEDVEAGVEQQIMARRFHTTLVEIILAVCSRLLETTGLMSVVLSGGTFMNSLLTIEVNDRLTREGFRVYRHRYVPPNDGGLCLGQLAIAATLADSAG